MRWSKRIATGSRVGAIRREVLLGLVVLAALGVGFGAMLILLPRDQPVRLEPMDNQQRAGEDALPTAETAAGAASQKVKRAAEDSQEEWVKEWESSQSEAPVDHSNLPDHDNMAYTGFPRFTAVPTIVPRITTTRLSGVTPAVFHFSIQDTLMPGATLENGIPVNPWRDLHVEWDFGDPNGPDRMTDPRFGTIVNPNTDQVGPEAVYVYRTPGTYTVTAKVKARTGRDQYVTASATTIRTNQVQRIFIPAGTTGTFRLGWGGNWTDPIEIRPAYYTNDLNFDSGSGTMYQVLDELESLPGLAGNVRGGKTENSQPGIAWIYEIEFCNALGAQANPLIQIDSTSLVSLQQDRVDKLRAFYVGTTTGGAFRLRNTAGNGLPVFTTAYMPFNVTASAMATAINAAAGSTVVAVTGGPVGPSEIEIPYLTEWTLTWLAPYNLAAWNLVSVEVDPGTPWQGYGFQNNIPVPYRYVIGQNAIAPSTFDATAVEVYAGGTSESISVTDGGMLTRYYDSVGGNNANSGTSESAPRKTWADMRTWLEGATVGEYRRALWKRGTSIPDNGNFPNGLKYARIGAYGTGEKPILANTTAPLFNNLVGETSGRGVDWLIRDVVVSDLQCKVSPFNTGTTTAIRNPGRRVGWVSFLDLTIDIDMAFHGALTTQDVAFWNCFFDLDNYRYHALSYNCDWISVTGCRFRGGRCRELPHPGAAILDHVVYPTNRFHECFRWAHQYQGVEETSLSTFLRGTVDEMPGPGYCRFICDSLVEAIVSGVSCYSGGSVNPWFRFNTANRGVVDCFLVSGVWIYNGSSTGEMKPKVNSNGTVDASAPQERYSRMDNASKVSTARFAVYRGCKVWAGPRNGYDYQWHTIDPQYRRMAAAFAMEAATGFTAFDDGLVTLHVYDCDVWHDGFGAVIQFQSGVSAYVVDNRFACNARANLFVTPGAPPLYFERNAIHVMGNETRDSIVYEGTGYSIAEAKAAGLIGDSNVVRKPSWSNPDEGRFDGQRGTTFGSIPVRLRDDRGWPRGEK